MGHWTEPHPQDVTVAALFALPFAGYAAALHQLAPPTDAQWSLADPILWLLPRAPTLRLVPVAALLLAVVWWRIARPVGGAWRRGTFGALAGASLAMLGAGALRLIAGRTLPWFIPPEESAGPGFMLSMTAGLQEELLCRLALMPALFFSLRDRVPVAVRAAMAVAATALSFAVWHALGEPTVSVTYFAVRFVLPGCAMSLAWLASPAAIVVGHSTAHLLIPALFVAPPA